MKKLIVFCFLNTLLLVTLCAQSLGEIHKFVNGPAKQVTILNRQGYAAQYGVLKTIFKYDSLGRITHEAEFLNEMLGTGYFYEYSNDSICWRYEYGDEGLDGRSWKIVLNSDGRKLYSLQYYKDRLVGKDSLVYNKYGKIAEKYCSPYGETNLRLEVVYTYDSLGRLIEEKEVRQQRGYTIKYVSNGHYQKRIYEKGHLPYTEKYTFDSNNRLIKRKSQEEVEEFSCFDKYDNWTKSLFSVNTHEEYGWLETSTERIIEYYE